MKLDAWLVSNGIVLSPNEANGFIMAGKVLVNDTIVTSPAYKVKSKDNIRLRNVKSFVSRSASKLNQALQEFSISVKDRTVVDIGASTGGFTEVLLRNNAKVVYAVDVAYGILDNKIRSNPAVVVMDRTHACELTADSFLEKPDLLVMDLSFISLRKVLLHFITLFDHMEGVLLFKPQFEVSSNLLTNGICTNEKDRLLAIDSFNSFCMERNIQVKGFIPCSLLGLKGNQEYLFHIEW
jgi:23S rRNA (cytidine1920-2'-O)/16S rRNA (cytidine1409-2'-O)-methyltransferase